MPIMKTISALKDGQVIQIEVNTQHRAVNQLSAILLRKAKGVVIEGVGKEGVVWYSTYTRVWGHRLTPKTLAAFRKRFDIGSVDGQEILDTLNGIESDAAADKFQYHFGTEEDFSQPNEEQANITINTGELHKWQRFKKTLLPEGKEFLINRYIDILKGQLNLSPETFRKIMQEYGAKLQTDAWIAIVSDQLHTYRDHKEKLYPHLFFDVSYALAGLSVVKGRPFENSCAYAEEEKEFITLLRSKPAEINNRLSQLTDTQLAFLSNMLPKRIKEIQDCVQAFQQLQQNNQTAITAWEKGVRDNFHQIPSNRLMQVEKSLTERLKTLNWYSALPAEDFSRHLSSTKLAMQQEMTTMAREELIALVRRHGLAIAESISDPAIAALWIRDATGMIKPSLAYIDNIEDERLFNLCHELSERVKTWQDRPRPFKGPLVREARMSQSEGASETQFKMSILSKGIKLLTQLNQLPSDMDEGVVHDWDLLTVKKVAGKVKYTWTTGMQYDFDYFYDNFRLTREHNKQDIGLLQCLPAETLLKIDFMLELHLDFMQLVSKVNGKTELENKKYLNAYAADEIHPFGNILQEPHYLENVTQKTNWPTLQFEKYIKTQQEKYNEEKKAERIKLIQDWQQVALSQICSLVEKVAMAEVLREQVARLTQQISIPHQDFTDAFESATEKTHVRIKQALRAEIALLKQALAEKIVKFDWADGVDLGTVFSSDPSKLQQETFNVLGRERNILQQELAKLAAEQRQKKQQSVVKTEATQEPQNIEVLYDIKMYGQTLVWLPRSKQEDDQSPVKGPAKVAKRKPIKNEISPEEDPEPTYWLPDNKPITTTTVATSMEPKVLPQYKQTVKKSFSMREMVSKRFGHKASVAGQEIKEKPLNTLRK